MVVYLCVWGFSARLHFCCFLCTFSFLCLFPLDSLLLSSSRLCLCFCVSMCVYVCVSMCVLSTFSSSSLCQFPEMSLNLYLCVSVCVAACVWSSLLFSSRFVSWYWSVTLGCLWLVSCILVSLFPSFFLSRSNIRVICSLLWCGPA